MRLLALVSVFGLALGSWSLSDALKLTFATGATFTVSSTTITTDDTLSLTVSGVASSDNFYAYLLSDSPSCQNNAASPDCKFVCAPLNAAASTISPYCLSSHNYSRFDGPNFVPSFESSFAAGDITFDFHVDTTDTYSAVVYPLTSSVVIVTWLFRFSSLLPLSLSLCRWRSQCNLV